MSGSESLEKLYHIRENEMNEAQNEYSRAIDYFETVGGQLYELLKRKEETENSVSHQLKKRMKMADLIHYERYYQKLLDEEKVLQMKVHQARVNMNHKQSKLTLSYQELKKLEKIIEKKKEEQLLMIKKEEMKFIDEISVQQYLRQK